MTDERDFAEGTPEYWIAMHDRLVSEGRLTPPASPRTLTPAGARALVLGSELDRLNGLRERRRQTMRSAWWDRIGPAAQAGYLMDLAHLDKRRRELRDLLADQLSQVPLSVSWYATAPSWTGPRHARP
jgi:hypothetical protein